jgi:hypothetical protein
VQSPATLPEYETAYHTRLVIDQLRFAIKNTERFESRTNSIEEVRLQLLDALTRLEHLDRKFQDRVRGGDAREDAIADVHHNGNELSLPSLRQEQPNENRRTHGQRITRQK